jgi:hypothetical protein
MITTNDHVNPAKVEPRKLDIRTTEQIATQAPEPVTRGADLGKMITTHDEPKAKKGKAKKSE